MKLDDTIKDWSSYQAVIARLKEPDSSNAVPSRDTIIEELMQATSGKEGSLVDQIDKSIQRFMNAARAMNVPMDSPEMQEVSKARELKDYLKQNADKLPEAKKAVSFAKQQVAIATNPAANPARGFSKALTAMLNDPACDQFMKAVADLKEGTRGIGTSSSGGPTESFSTVSNRARTAAGNDNVDPQGSRLNSVMRGVNVAGSVVDVLSLGGTGLGIGLDFHEALHPEAESSTTDNSQDNAGNNESNTGNNESNQTEAGETEKELTPAEKTAAIWSAATDTVGAAVSLTSSTLESAQLIRQEKARRDKIKAMTGTDPNNPNAAAKKLRSYNRADHATQVANWVGTGGSVVGAVNSIWGADAGKDMDETKSTGMSVGADGAAILSDVLGLGANSAKAEQVRKQDAMAKDSMRTIGEQLEKSIEGKPQQGKILTIAKICQRLKNRRFNARSKREGTLTSLIDAALAPSAPSTGGQSSQSTQTGSSSTTGNAAGSTGSTPANTPAADELDSKQKGLLSTLKMLEKSRGISKGAAADARKGVGFDVVGMVGDLFSLGSSIAGVANSPVVAAALRTVSAAIGLVGMATGGIDAIKEKTKAGKQDRIDDRKKKRDMCQDAVEQMASLPELSADQLTQMRLTEQNKMQMPEQVIMNAEQYAAAFSMVKSADVNMVDFLYAIHMGFADQSPDLGPAGTQEEKLTRMFKAMNV